MNRKGASNQDEHGAYLGIRFCQVTHDQVLWHFTETNRNFQRDALGTSLEQVLWRNTRRTLDNCTFVNRPTMKVHHDVSGFTQPSGMPRIRKHTIAAACSAPLLLFSLKPIAVSIKQVKYTGVKSLTTSHIHKSKISEDKSFTQE